MKYDFIVLIQKQAAQIIAAIAKSSYKHGLYAIPSHKRKDPPPQISIWDERS